MDLQEKKRQDKEKVYDILADKLRVDRSMIKDDSNLRDDLGGDSLDVIEIVMEIEKEFNMIIEDSLYGKVLTVGDVVKLVEKDND